VLTPFKQSVGFQDKHASGYAARKSNAFTLGHNKKGVEIVFNPLVSYFSKIISHVIILLGFMKPEQKGNKYEPVNRRSKKM
jgi:hypothetical protein